MNINARTRTGLIVALLVLSGALLVAEGDADSVSAASAGAYYYADSSLEGDALYDLMASRQAAEQAETEESVSSSESATISSRLHVERTNASAATPDSMRSVVSSASSCLVSATCSRTEICAV